MTQRGQSGLSLLCHLCNFSGLRWIINNRVRFCEDSDILNTLSSIVFHSSSEIRRMSSPQPALQFKVTALDTWQIRELYIGGDLSLTGWWHNYLCEHRGPSQFPCGGRGLCQYSVLKNCRYWKNEVFGRLNSTRSDWKSRSTPPQYNCGI